ncbi:hypothetical protein IW245_000286 [Longispora fulva]|uniref:Uncharacterized protein n=1 Tax=Longispora fulva TaxID=619741 RepID=A0A8J7GCV3_9ACTN|nr:hypothetical protein [Longispora fulva]
MNRTTALAAALVVVGSLSLGGTAYAAGAGVRPVALPPAG